MPWPIVLHGSLEEARLAGGGEVQIGAMWPMDDEQFASWGDREGFLARGLGRPPMYVSLPGGTWFLIDSRFYDPAHGGFYGEGWNPTGQAPQVTLHPSVNNHGRYHGWIQNGVISDDVEGRTFA